MLHEVRSKAHRRLNVVLLVSVLIMVLYVEVGERALSIEVAKRVPMVWKCLTFLTMFAVLWYADWRIQRRVFDLALPALEPRWVACLALVAVTFAVVSADVRVLFYVGTSACLVYLWLFERYYKRKGEGSRKHDTQVAQKPPPD